MDVLEHVLDALRTTGLMTWQIAWSLVLGFTLSAVVQAVVRREAVSRLLGDARPATLAKAAGLGAASSSCYRKYYGTRMMLVLLGAFYVTMVVGGYVVELLFGGLGLVPAPGEVEVAEAGISLNYTTVLNVIAFALAILLVVRFVRTGGGKMLQMMGGDPS